MSSTNVNEHTEDFAACMLFINLVFPVVLDETIGETVSICVAMPEQLYLSGLRRLRHMEMWPRSYYFDANGFDSAIRETFVTRKTS